VNRVVDALSRRPCIFSVLPLQTNLREKILTLQRDDDWYKEVEGFIGQNTMMVPRYEGFSFDSDGLLRFKSSDLRTAKRRVEDVDPERGS
jgi:hypothetical protein